MLWVAAHVYSTLTLSWLYMRYLTLAFTFLLACAARLPPWIFILALLHSDDDIADDGRDPLS